MRLGPSQHFFTPTLALLTVALASCASSTRLVGSWRNPSYRSASLRKPLVVAVANDRMVRVRVEDEIVLGLRRLGVEGLASHAVFPENEPTLAEVKHELRPHGRDSIIVTHLVDPTREKLTLTGGTVARRGGADALSANYTEAYNAVRAAGYAYERNNVELETNLYDATTDKLVWTAATESGRPDTLDAALTSFASVLRKDLEKKHIFGRP